jgi:predicted Zn-dependent protease
MNEFLRQLALATLLLAATGSASAFNFGSLNPSDLQHALSIGKKAIDANKDIGESEEITIGNGVAARILGAWPLVPNPALQKYVNRVGFWLAMQTDRPTLPWRFGVINSDSINAFSCPGGTILITKGLYKKLRNESELAGVLGHEITHVLRKHQLKAIQQQMGNDWKTELAQTAADKQSNTAASDAALKAYKAGTELFTRGLDKDSEYEADRMGVIIATRAGYNPFGLVGVLQTLDAVSPSDSGTALMWKTHPSPASRLDKLSGAIGDQLDAYQNLLTDTTRFDNSRFHK